MSSSLSPCCDSTDPPTTQAQQPPDITNSKGHAVSANANSVLKSLFLSLSPYQQEEEQQDSMQSSVSSGLWGIHLCCWRNMSVCVICLFNCILESKKTKKSNMGCAFSTQQQTQSSDQQFPDKTVPDSTGSQPSSQTPLTSVQATGRSSCRNPGTPGPQVRKSGSHNLPFKPVVQLMQHHTQLRLARTSEERKLVNGNVADTPLKDLFKTLDTTVFHLGH
ncbi:hypothetical protein INR49_031137 [Caranx melampygus]|nr:hypothetical protein INR49_031137 [Caranx melampygus]